jgi:hypothetical protein
LNLGTVSLNCGCPVPWKTFFAEFTALIQRKSHCYLSAAEAPNKHCMLKLGNQENKKLGITLASLWEICLRNEILHGLPKDTLQFDTVNTGQCARHKMPGCHTVRRHTDQLVTIHLPSLQPVRGQMVPSQVLLGQPFQLSFLFSFLLQFYLPG